MAVELATAYLSLVPSLRGLQSAVQGELAPVSQAAAKTGAESGRNFAGGFSNTFKGTLGALGVGALIGGIGALAHETITATEDESAAQARLQAAIRATGGSVSDYEGRLRATHTTMEALGFSSAAIDDALSRLVTVTKNPAAAMQDLALSANLARARNIDLTTAATIVGRVAQGNTGILARYGISLDVTGGKVNQVRAAHDSLTKAQDALGRVQDSLAGKTHLTAAEHDRLAAAQQKVVDAQAKLTATTNAGTTAMGALSQMFGGQASAYAGSFAGKMAALKAQLEDTLAKVGTAAVPAIQILVGAFAPALAAVASALPPIAHGLADVVGFLRQHSAIVKPLAVALLAMFAAWKIGTAVLNAYRIASTLWTAVTKAQTIAAFASKTAFAEMTLQEKIATAITKAWTIAQAIFNAVMDAGPIILVVAAVAALAAIAYVVYRNWGTISAFFIRLWHDIVRIFDTSITWIKQHWQLLASILLVILTGPIGAVIALVFHFRDQIVSFFESIPGALLGALEAFPGLLVSLIKGGLDLLLNLFITWPLMATGYLIIGGVKLAEGLYNGIMAAIPVVWNFFTSLPGRILSFVVGVDTWLLETGLHLLEGLANGIVTAAGAVWGFFTALPGRILSFVVGTDRWLLGAGIAIASGLAYGIASAATAVWDWLSALPGRILGAVVYAGAWLIGAGMAVINGLKLGLESAFNAIVGWLENLGSSIWDHIKKGLGPLGQFLSPKTKAGVMIGQGLGLGILHGVESMLPQIGNAGARVNGALMGGANLGSFAVAGAGSRAGGPAVVIHQADFHDQADVNMLLNQASFALAAKRL